MSKNNSEIGKIDEEYIARGKTIIGVDDVGRGCIAGNMYIGFVSFNPLSSYPGIDDSKKLSKIFKDDEKRFKLDNFIRNNSRHLVMQVSINQINTDKNLNELFRIQFINGLNILTNSMKINKKDLVVFLDGLDTYDNDLYNIEYRAKFDALSYNVAAASIIAKNVQVSAMRELDSKFPDYKFSSHNGYSTDKHREAIKKYGTCSAHRVNWIK